MQYVYIYFVYRCTYILYQCLCVYCIFLYIYVYYSIYDTFCMVMAIHKSRERERGREFVVGRGAWVGNLLAGRMGLQTSQDYVKYTQRGVGAKTSQVQQP